MVVEFLTSTVRYKQDDTILVQTSTSKLLESRSKLILYAAYKVRYLTTMSIAKIIQ